MTYKIVFVERKPYGSFSIEKAFRQVAAGLSVEFDTEFQQLPYGNRVWDTVCNLLFFRKKNAQIYHITGHVHYIALLFSRRNTVLSIMDVGFLYTKRGLRRLILKKLYLDWPLRRLDYITAISEHTKSEIIRYTGCDTNKILVLDLPLVFPAESENISDFNEQKPTVLQIGTTENKNIANLAKALNGIGCKLRVIGRMTAHQVDVLKENNVEFENAYDQTDEQVRSEYRMADLVVFCSTYEGFGLPIIEAQSMRKPVITSNLSPMIETSGGAAMLVDPNDFLSIRDGIRRLISDSGFRNDLIEAGVRNVERFAPTTVAAGYADLYKKILD